MGNKNKPKVQQNTNNNCGKHNSNSNNNSKSKSKNTNIRKSNGLSKKNNIPKKIREEVWKHYNGSNYKSACKVSWCTNIIDVFNYHVGHDVPESKGGKLDIINLKPICSNCNLSMGDRFSITDWDKIGINERMTVQNLKLYLKLSLFLLGSVSVAFVGLYNEPHIKEHAFKLFN